MARWFLDFYIKSLQLVCTNFFFLRTHNVLNKVK